MSKILDAFQKGLQKKSLSSGEMELIDEMSKTNTGYQALIEKVAEFDIQMKTYRNRDKMKKELARTVQKKDPFVAQIAPTTKETNVSDYFGDEEAEELGGSTPSPVFNASSFAIPGGKKKRASQPKRAQLQPTLSWDGDMGVEKTYTPRFEEDMEVHGADNPSDAEDFDNIKEAFQVFKTNEKTIVLAIVVDKEDDERNIPSAIRCYGGSAFGGYAHDLSRDSYLVRCTDFVEIGSLPFSLLVTMLNVGDWQMRVPIPTTILDKFFSPKMKKLVSDYQERYPKPRYEIHFIQMLGCR